VRRCRISGWGTALPDVVVRYGDRTRHRVPDDLGQLDLLAEASLRAIARAGLSPDDVDLVVAACAAGVQPIPCTAALVLERVAPGARAAAFDVSSTCTSFVTALDVVSRLVDGGAYDRALVVSGDVGSRFLDPAAREAAELFSDAGAAVVVTRTDVTDDDGPGVLASLQQTWPAHAHDTELRGGLSLHPAQAYADGDPADYLFDMDGRRALRGMLRVLPGFFDRFFEGAGLTWADLDRVVPHQASGALGLAMRKVGCPPGLWIDRVDELGNMVSASVPYVLAEELEAGRLGPGDTVLLCGTAAGLTANALALRL